MKKEDVFVVTKFNTTDIGDIYLSKSDAQIVCDENNNSLFDIYRKRFKKATDKDIENYISFFKYHVMTLNDAINMIVEYVEQYSSDNDGYPDHQND